MAYTEKETLEFIAQGKMFELTTDHFASRAMTQNEMIAIFNAFNAIWYYHGDPSPEKPHAILRTGDHSNGFISCMDVLQYAKMNHLFAYELYKLLARRSILHENKIDVVVSSAYSAICLGSELARILSNLHNPMVEYIQAEKDKDRNPTKIRRPIAPEKTVLVVNELMTHGNGSTWMTKEAVLHCNDERKEPAPMIIPESIVLVHRSKDFVLPDGSLVVPLFPFNIEDWKPEDCPYCKAGSKAIKPKLDNNWNIIHGRA